MILVFASQKLTFKNHIEMLMTLQYASCLIKANCIIVCGQNAYVNILLQGGSICCGGHFIIFYVHDF